ncbi:LamG domain-containing protein [Allorhodopirellula solitaria]|uniref:hypothetical protein n=1 Tax=Allorhodopirellula solitaria TaxID=2527987 RepID=UPI001644CFE0|nr:hypothetical protein [Allorhodopirellula solitaria]
MIRSLRHFALSTMTIAAIFAVSATSAVCQEGRLRSSENGVQDAAEAVVKQSFTPLRGSWKKVVFGGEGAVHFSKTDKGDELVEMLAGDPLTGIRWTGDFPQENYELRLQARRIEGFDFFAAITFPVGKEHCSFVLGGWGGGMVGISSIDGNDASTNQTTQYKEFETNRWYTIRIRVDDEAVRCWIDEDEYALVPRGESELSIRIEMDPCLPMGIANYITRSELKSIGLRRIGPAAQQAASPTAKPAEDSATPAPIPAPETDGPTSDAEEKR